MSSLSPDFDVIVVGAGPGGFAAAVAAARGGARTLLIERYGFAGGLATAGLVNPFMSYTLPDGGARLTGPVFNELIDRMYALGAMNEGKNIFDDERMKFVLDDMLREAGVTVLFHSLFAGVEVDGGVVRTVHTHGKSGRQSFQGRIVIDGTGDGDVAAAAGSRVEMGREEDGRCQPMTLCFRMAGVDPSWSDTSGGLWSGNKGLRGMLTEILDRAKADRRVDQPREDVLLFHTLDPSVIHFNTTRVVGRSATSTLDMTAAEFEARRQVRELSELFRAECEFFKNAYVSKMAAQIGVRESRRAIGEVVLTEDDVLGARKFDDAVARCNYSIDIHNPAGGGTVIKRIPKGDYYEIPYHCLLPEGPENLVMACRAIGATHEAHSSLRIMPTVATFGEAAGRAAARAVRDKTSLREVDGAALKAEMYPASAEQPAGG